jgi:hypothetical protein
MLREVLSNHPARTSNTEQRRADHNNHDRYETLHQRRTLLLSDRGSRPASATSQRATSTRPFAHATRRDVQPLCLCARHTPARCDANRDDDNNHTTKSNSTDVVAIRSSIATSFSDKPTRHVDVTVAACSQKGCQTVLLPHKQRSCGSQQQPRSRPLEQRTHVRPLRSSIAASFSDEPPHNLKVTFAARSQKGRHPFLLTQTSQTLPITRSATTTTTARTAQRTHICPL